MRSAVSKVSVGKVVAAAAAFTVVWLIIAISIRVPGPIAGAVEGVVVGVGALTAYTVIAIRVSRERRRGQQGAEPQ